MPASCPTAALAIGIEIGGTNVQSVTAGGTVLPRYSSHVDPAGEAAGIRRELAKQLPE